MRGKSIRFSKNNLARLCDEVTLRDRLSALVTHVLFLECQYRIALEVAQINSLALFLHFRMLLAEQPAYVREEKASCSVVRISVGLAVLVMNSVIPGPIDRGILKRVIHFVLICLFCPYLTNDYRKKIESSTFSSIHAEVLFFFVNNALIVCFASM